MDGAKEDLVDMFIVHTTEEIQVTVYRSPCDIPSHITTIFSSFRVWSTHTNSSSRRWARPTRSTTRSWRSERKWREWHSSTASRAALKTHTPPSPHRFDAMMNIFPARCPSSVRRVLCTINSRAANPSNSLVSACFAAAHPFLASARFGKLFPPVYVCKRLSIKPSYCVECILRTTTNHSLPNAIL